RYEQDAAQLPAQVLQFLNHHLPPEAIQTAEPFINNHRFDGPMLPAGVLPDAERQTHRHAEFLTSGEEGDVDRLVAGNAVMPLPVTRLAPHPLPARLARQAQKELPP